VPISSSQRGVLSTNEGEGKERRRGASLFPVEEERAVTAFSFLLLSRKEEKGEKRGGIKEDGLLLSKGPGEERAVGTSFLSPSRMGRRGEGGKISNSLHFQSFSAGERKGGGGKGEERDLLSFQHPGGKEENSRVCYLLLSFFFEKRERGRGYLEP